ncbi:uncharacterized protein PFL1_02232 [Pseudozyma flocculosa PF-1]|uniref:Rgp1-domain-containing protein n=1 Tax=Pseudozyma flocculosa TaxID=84751 RepID=A0A5C3FB45_9BASI|nr:uncharacterized protein PFL1_02232 [Pseudozyma flocculosa PF-1]EPQ30115.1 hypothetical protein PFL1_02232 [Pseudozyma flocculosa PF-1]SPO41470.1 uncharacterized protein PSFLO_06952 [Pseudozyma flocculosa]
MAMPSSAHYSSALSVSVKPLQSSFFAGEDFVCTITFTNTNPKVTHTQPIPQTAAFSANATLHSHPDDAAAFDDPATPTQSPAYHAGRRVVSSQPFSKTHSNKSKSVDVRAIASPHKPTTTNTASSHYSLDGQLTRSRRSKALLRQMDGEQLPERKGLIGAPHPAALSSAHSSTTSSSAAFAPWVNLQSNSNASSQRQHAKSASVSVGPWNTAADRGGLGLGIPPPSSSERPGVSPHRIAPPAQEALARLQISPSPSHSPSPVGPRGSSLGPALGGPGRKTSATISAKHPHSRKKSVAQTQAEDLTEAFELDPANDRAIMAPAMSASTSSSASTPSTPVGRNPSQNSPWGSDNFYKLGQNDTMESVFRDSINDWSQDMRRQGGGGSAKSPLYPNNDLLPPGTEKILWSFAQFGGLVEIDESLVKPGDFENLKQRLAYGDLTGASASSVPGTPRGVIGGGDLGHEESDSAGGVSRNGRSSSWSGYLRHALGSGGGASGLRGRHRRTGSTLQDTRERTLQSRSVPTFSSPPSILAVDLTLGPEESKSYTFRLQLPVDLPPSYHGKSIKFQYNLSIGTNKLDTAVNARQAQRSRLIQVPIRVYNHVTTSGIRPFYDLMNPIILLREQAVVEADDGTGPSTIREHATASRQGRPQIKTTRAELEGYVREQLRSRSPSGGTVAQSGTGSEGLDPFGMTEGLPQESCKAAVETLSRTSSKVSYDISKDSKVAAVLTLVKSRYRLGETVMAMISINQPGSLARIARFAATLETFEEVQPSIALLPPGRMQRTTRKVHAEYHESTLDKGRVSFALPVPSGEGPEFVTSGVKLNWTLRLSFLTISRIKPPPPTDGRRAPARKPPPVHLVDSSSDGFALYHTSKRALTSLAGPIVHNDDGEEDGEEAEAGAGGGETKLETVECSVPITVLPNSTGFKVGAAVFFA